MMDLLTDRQNQIMGLVAQGKSNSQIAVELDLSVQTVKNTLSEVYKRIGASNRVSATLKFLGAVQ